jgi:hypothetical protein
MRVLHLRQYRFPILKSIGGVTRRVLRTTAAPIFSTLQPIVAAAHFAKACGQGAGDSDLPSYTHVHLSLPFCPAAGAYSTGRRNTLIMEVFMGRPAGWMLRLSGRGAMRSPGAPSLRREGERQFRSRLPPESRVRRRPKPLACRRRWARAGSVIVVACHCSCRSLCLRGICRSWSEKRLPFCGSKTSGSGR